MIRVVLDTNVIVSASIAPHGLPASVLLLVLHFQLQMCVSEAILAEYETVLRRPKFRRTDKFVATLIAELRACSEVVRPTRKLSVSRDEPDNRFLECAEIAGADYLVTGNKRHFPKAWGKTKVVNARELLGLLVPGIKPR